MASLAGISQSEPKEPRSLIETIEEILVTFKLTGRERNKAFRRPPARWRRTAFDPIVDAQLEVGKAVREASQSGPSAAAVISHLEAAINHLARAYMALLKEDRR